MPEAFRDAVQSDASRSHEWRQKLVRLVAPLSKDNRASAGGASSTSERPPPPVGAAGGGWSNSFNLRSNKVAADSPPGTSPPGTSTLQGTGAPPLSSLHRPKMRL